MGCGYGEQRLLQEFAKDDSSVDETDNRDNYARSRRQRDKRIGRGRSVQSALTPKVQMSD